jgi:cysteine desulfurase/selenocysteine lyase
VGLAAAVEYLDSLGMDDVLAHERSLMASAQRKLEELEGFVFIGPPARSEVGL